MKRKRALLMPGFLPGIAPFVFILVLGFLLLVVAPLVMRRVLHWSHSTAIVVRLIIMSSMLAFIIVAFMSYLKFNATLINISILIVLIVFASIFIPFLLKKKREQNNRLL